MLNVYTGKHILFIIFAGKYSKIKIAEYYYEEIDDATASTWHKNKGQIIEH